MLPILVSRGRNVMAVEQDQYPLRFDVDYPEEVDRFSSFFRLFFLIPIIIVLAAVVGSGAGAARPRHAPIG